MSAGASSAYGLGASLGLVSVQISRLTPPLVDIPTNAQRVALIADGLITAQRFAKALAGHGITNWNSLELRLSRLVKAFATVTSAASHIGSVNIADLRNDLGSAIAVATKWGVPYSLGLGIAMAEGQSSVLPNDPAAFPLMKDGLNRCVPIAQRLSKVIDPAPLRALAKAANHGQMTLHGQIVSVRLQYQRKLRDTKTL